MAAPSPSLSLSDIMHPFSPPPTAAQPKSTSPPPRARSITPEPLELAEIEEMRRKIMAMGWGDSAKGKDKMGTREQELVDMLLRLTHPASLPQPSQLHAQAETIANLIQQRDFLVQRSIEEHERWASEREGWARAAQALIVQGRRETIQAEKEEAVAAQYALVTVDASTQRMQEFERANIALQSDKKALEQKLADTQRRLALLESELAQLKPLLLMQPFALTHSHPTGTARGWSAVLPTSSSAAATRREKGRRGLDDDPEADEDPDSNDDVPPQQLQPRPQFRNPILRPASPASSPGSPFKPKGDYYRRRDPPTPSVYYPSAQYSKTARRKGQPPAASKPVLSDARAEHLLLAARKIGRQRASILSGAFAHVQQPEPAAPPKQKAAQTKAPQPPRTPRRGANANTPLLTRTPLGLPRTPLQSLLSAAQSVLSAPGSVSPSANESPLAKRRKLDTSAAAAKRAETPVTVRKERAKDKEKEKDEDGDKQMAQHGDKDKEKDGDTDKDKEQQKAAVPGGVARVRSALDFLADQAEVYSTQPSQGSADSGGSPPKDIEDAPSQDVEMGDAEESTSTHALDKGKGKAATPTPSASENTPLVEKAHLQPPRTGGSRSATPRVSTRQSQRAGTPASAHAPLTLAPPITLTPRASRSPAPSAAAEPPNPRKRSRSGSTERSKSPAPAEGAFSIFTVQGPTPRLAARLGEPAADLDAGPASKVVEGVKLSVDALPRRTRSPYIKWTKDEDEQLAKAVAKYGQKWDLVQKDLPTRGYHQVRQRWLRKLGVFDGSKLDLASLETNAAAEFLNISTAPPAEEDGARSASDPRSAANPKLGLAPLNSERVLTGSSSSRSMSPFGSGTGAGAAGFPFPGDISHPQPVRQPGEGG